jgi:hypothetical protein
MAAPVVVARNDLKPRWLMSRATARREAEIW